MQVTARARQIGPGGTGLIALLVGMVVIIAVIVAALVFNANNDGTKASTQSSAPAAAYNPPMAGQRDVPVAGSQLKAQYNRGSGEGLVGGGSREALQETIAMDRLDRIEMNRLLQINVLPGDAAASATPDRSLTRDRFIEANTMLPTASETVPPQRPGHPR